MASGKPFLSRIWSLMSVPLEQLGQQESVLPERQGQLVLQGLLVPQVLQVQPGYPVLQGQLVLQAQSESQVQLASARQERQAPRVSLVLPARPVQLVPRAPVSQARRDQQGSQDQQEQLAPQAQRDQRRHSWLAFRRMETQRARQASFPIRSFSSVAASSPCLKARRWEAPL